VSGERCPVCTMAVAESTITASYLSLSYRFCSGQCRQNFLVHPTLYIGMRADKQHRPQRLKKRSFSLDTPPSDQERQAIVETLSALMGVRAVSLDGKRLSISYDLLEATAQQIETALLQIDGALDQGWLQRLKRGWINYSEETELDNLTSEPSACCNKPPAKG